MDNGNPIPLGELTDKEKQSLYAEIKKKIPRSHVANDDENVFLEYLIVMVQNGKNREQVKQELQTFIGSDSENFTNWYIANFPFF